jgi:hypothetical protein
VTAAHRMALRITIRIIGSSFVGIVGSDGALAMGRGLVGSKRPCFEVARGWL